MDSDNNKVVTLKEWTMYIIGKECYIAYHLNDVVIERKLSLNKKESIYR